MPSSARPHCPPTPEGLNAGGLPVGVGALSVIRDRDRLWPGADDASQGAAVSVDLVRPKPAWHSTHADRTCGWIAAHAQRSARGPPQARFWRGVLASP